MAPVNTVITNMPHAPTTVLQTATSQPPLLSAGSITIANLCKFDYACKCFFTYKEIPADEQVGCIIYSFELEFMQSWIESDSDHLTQGDQEFYKWSVSICKANNELEATDSLQHIPHEHFHTHLIVHLNPALCLAYHASKKELDAVENIKAWICWIM